MALLLLGFRGGYGILIVGIAISYRLQSGRIVAIVLSLSFKPDARCIHMPQVRIPLDPSSLYSPSIYRRCFVKVDLVPQH